MHQYKEALCLNPATIVFIVIQEFSNKSIYKKTDRIVKDNIISWLICQIRVLAFRNKQKKNSALWEKWAGLKFEYKNVNLVGNSSFLFQIVDSYLGNSGVFWPRKYVSVSFSPALIALRVCGNFLCLNRWLNKEKPLSEWLAPTGENWHHAVVQHLPAGERHEQTK